MLKTRPRPAPEGRGAVNQSDLADWPGRDQPRGVPQGAATLSPAIAALILFVHSGALGGTGHGLFHVSLRPVTHQLEWRDAPIPSVCTLEIAESVQGPWRPVRNAFAVEPAGAMSLENTEANQFYRMRAVEVAGTDQGFRNFVNAYGLLERVAGNGEGQEDGISYWNSANEGGFAPWAALSRPHYAQADRAGNIYIVDKNSHTILKVTRDGRIQTHAGTHTEGFNGEGPGRATELQLSFPNGGWVNADGTVYILDSGNGRVRRVDPDGTMTTLFMATASGSSLRGGRGLWVASDESLAYFCAGDRIRRWTPAQGVRTLVGGFGELGTLFVEESGDILVCDRQAHLAYRVTARGGVTVLAGNGTPTGGGEGFHALDTGLNGVRSIWPLPNGGYFLLTHDGCQLWYLDPAGIMRLFLNGDRGRTHAGNDQFFYDPEPRISEGRSVTMDDEGNVLITESDWGYVRRIRFLPLQ